MRNSDEPVEALKDTDLMPFGKHKGEPMVSVPPDYLMWLDGSCGRHKRVQQYITDNIDVLKSQIKNSNK